MKISYVIIDFLWRTPLSRLMRKFPFTKCKRQPWSGEMVLEGCGNGHMVKHPGCYMSASEELRWVSREKNAEGEPVKVRKPMESSELFPEESFVAAGKHYRGIGQLFVKMDDSSYWCRDIYGREVFYVAERFPCFDCFDSMYEDRCYRWFFLREDERLTRVFFSDGSWEVHVTEDVENIEEGCWEKMLERNYFDWEPAAEND